MIVVAIIAILATVVIPSWFRESQVGKARSEVSAMFTELATKEEQYFIDNDAYLAMGVCPALPNAQGQDVIAPCTATWINQLRVVPPQTKMTCTYEVDVGPATTNPGPTVGSVGQFIVPAPSTSWYYIIATCDADNDPTLYS